MTRYHCMKCAGATEHELIAVGARDGRVRTRYQCSACGNVVSDADAHVTSRVADRDTEPDIKRAKP